MERSHITNVIRETSRIGQTSGNTVKTFLVHSMNDIVPTSMTIFMRDHPTKNLTNLLHLMTDMLMHPLTTGYQTPVHLPMIKNSLMSFLPM